MVGRNVIIAYTVGVFALVAIACGEDMGAGNGGSGSSSSAEKKQSSSEKDSLTSGQANALQSAKNYLELSAFSKKGLIEQLSSPVGEGYSKADARFAANNVGADWKAEAVEAAENYLEMTSFSEQGLIEQLSSSAGEGFTVEQARYAVKKVY